MLLRYLISFAILFINKVSKKFEQNADDYILHINKRNNSFNRNLIFNIFNIFNRRKRKPKQPKNQSTPPANQSTPSQPPLSSAPIVGPQSTQTHVDGQQMYRYNTTNGVGPGHIMSGPTGPAVGMNSHAHAMAAGTQSTMYRSQPQQSQPSMSGQPKDMSAMNQIHQMQNMIPGQYSQVCLDFFQSFPF